MGLFDRSSLKPYIGRENVLNIIDGTNMFCRACLSNNTNNKKDDLLVTVEIFFRMFAKTMKTKPKYCAVVFDSGRKNFRHEIYPSYKSNRKKAYIENEETKYEIIKHILQYSGFKVIDSKQFEADDIIGSLIKFKDQVNAIRIYSEDKDFLQLIDDNVFLMKNNLVYDKNLCKKKFGVYPSQFIEYLMLVGDSVDCIPGVSKWGKGNASKYLSEFGSIKEIKKQKLTKSLQSIHSANFPLLKSLVKIKRNIRVIKNIKDLQISSMDNEAISLLRKKYPIFIGGIYG